MSFSCFITFPTTYYAIRAEKVLSTSNLIFKMVPVPRSISSSCGTALKISCEDVELVKNILLKEHVECEEVHKIEDNTKNFSLKSIFKKEKP